MTRYLHTEDEFSGKLIRPGSNAGRSVVIRPDPGTITTAASLALVPASPGSPVGQSTLLELEGLDAKSEVMSVTLVNPNPFRTPNFISKALARPIAKLEWGVDGVQAQAFCDFEHGFSFSVPASFLRVIGINDKLPATVEPALVPIFGRNIKLGAFCSYGTVSRGSTFNGKRTLYINNAALPFDAAVPDFATNFIAYGNGVPGSTISIDILDEAGFVIFTSVFPVDTPTSPAELSNDAAFVRYNVSPGIVTGRIVFGLSI